MLFDTNQKPVESKTVFSKKRGLKLNMNIIKCLVVGTFLVLGRQIVTGL